MPGLHGVHYENEKQRLLPGSDHPFGVIHCVYGPNKALTVHIQSPNPTMSATPHCALVLGVHAITRGWQGRRCNLVPENSPMRLAHVLGA